MSARKPKWPGLNNVLEALQNVDKSTYETILKNVAKKDPSLVELIKLRMFSFEDLANVNPKGLQQLILRFQHKDWALALKVASDDLKDAIFSNMSGRAAGTLKEEIQDQGKRKLSDVEEMQEKIMQIARDMEEKCELIRATASNDPLV